MLFKSTEIVNSVFEFFLKLLLLLLLPLLLLLWLWLWLLLLLLLILLLLLLSGSRVVVAGDGCGVKLPLPIKFSHTACVLVASDNQVQLLGHGLLVRLSLEARRTCFYWQEKGRRRGFSGALTPVASGRWDSLAWEGSSKRRRKTLQTSAVFCP